MKAVDRKRVDRAVRGRFVDGIDADEALRPDHPAERRWDYVLGDGAGRRLVGIEPHPAESGEVSAVIEKKRNTERWLRDHLRDGRRIVRWLRVGTGKASLPRGGKARLRLAQHGIEFAGGTVKASHLD